MSPSEVEIPSTRSGKGDILIFDHRIELKYANIEKPEKLDSILGDVELLLQSKISFFILGVRSDRESYSKHIHRYINLPKVRKKDAELGVGVQNLDGKSYNSLGLFLPAAFTHELQDITERDPDDPGGQGNRSSSYMSFEAAHSISRSCFIDTAFGLLHVDVIGSYEDGMICMLFKRADSIDIVQRAIRNSYDIVIPYEPTPFHIAVLELVDAKARSKKGSASVRALDELVESGIPLIRI